MEIQGKVVACLEPKSGTSAKGEWTSQDFVIEIPNGQYQPRHMVFNVWGMDRIQKFNIGVGQDVNVSFDIDAREYNGKWYNSIRAFDVRQTVPGASPAQQSQPAPAIAEQTAEEKLPF